jgi:hypothetical protein
LKNGDLAHHFGVILATPIAGWKASESAADQLAEILPEYMARHKLGKGVGYRDEGLAEIVVGNFVRIYGGWIQT